MNYVGLTEKQDIDHLFRRKRVGGKVRNVVAFNETWRHRYRIAHAELLRKLPNGSYNKFDMDVIVDEQTWAKKIMITLMLDDGDASKDIKLFDDINEFPSETLVAQMIILL